MTGLYKQIGEKIRELRNAYPNGSLSQEALAQKLGIAANTLSRWETGTYKPTAEDLDNLARFFVVPITVFFPEQKSDDTKVAALTSALGGLDEDDLDEVIKYAEFRKARKIINEHKPKGKKVASK